MTSRRDIQFQTFVIRGNERICMPRGLPRSLRQRVLSLFAPNRLITKYMWNLLSWLPVGLQVSPSYAVQQGLSSQLSAFDWQGWLDEVETELGVGPLMPFFYFPPQSVRRKFSVLMLDALGNPRAYAKHAWHGSEELVYLQRERSAARYLAALEPFDFDFPRLIYSSEYKETDYNVFEPLSVQCQPIRDRWTHLHTKFLRAMRQRTHQEVELQDAEWWSRSLALQGSWPDLAQRLVARSASVVCCAAHGDFLPWNLCVCTNGLSVFDWENFAPCAPILTDPLYFVLGTSYYYSKNTKWSAILSVLQQILPDDAQRDMWVVDLVAAMLYLKVRASDDKLDSLLDQYADSVVALLD